MLAIAAVAAARVCERDDALPAAAPDARRVDVARRFATRLAPFEADEPLRAAGAFLRRAAAARFLVA